MDIGVELHRNMQPGNSTALIAELAKFRPLFVEDPIPPDSAALRSARCRPRAPCRWRPASATRRSTSSASTSSSPGVSFIRPDVGIAGGFTHLLKICALAEAHHQGIIPHAVPSGPVATMAHVHLGIAVANWEVQEHVDQTVSPFTEMVDVVPTVVDGYLTPPDAPGIGIQLNDDYLREQ